MEVDRIIHGRTITPKEVTDVRELLEQHPDWSRRRLSFEVCERWDWRNAKGQLRDMACRTVLLRLHRAEIIKLPVARHDGHNQRRRHCIAHIDVNMTPLRVNLSALMPVQLIEARAGSSEHGIFKHLVHRHHYLGLNSVPGETISYLAIAADGRPVACLLFAAAAWKCAARDKFIGWSDAQRQGNLSLLTNNTRFLILPWVEVKCLASHVLSLAQRRIATDWIAKYGHPVHALETFVDCSRFRGTCYQAANWIKAGSTTGRTRNDRRHQIKTPIKDIYLYALNRRSFQELSQ